MLVEFQRVSRRARRAPVAGNIEAMFPAPVFVNPQFVATVFPSRRHDGCTVIRLSDGRGFTVRGNYTTVLRTLGETVSNLIEHT